MLTVIDCESVVRTWGRANSAISAAVSGRVFFSTPQAYATATPPNWVVMFLVSAIHEPSDMGLQQALIQFTVWGKTKALASQAALAIEQAVQQLRWGPPVTVDSAVIQTASVSQVRWRPDPTTNLARYDVDAEFLIRGAEA